MSSLGAVAEHFHHPLHGWLFLERRQLGFYVLQHSALEVVRECQVRPGELLPGCDLIPDGLRDVPAYASALNQGRGVEWRAARQVDAHVVYQRPSRTSMVLVPPL